VLQRHGPFGQLAQLGAIVHEGVRDVVALLAARQLAGNATCAVPVECRADELLVRVEPLPLPPHVTRTLEHLLERALRAMFQRFLAALKVLMCLKKEFGYLPVTKTLEQVVLDPQTVFFVERCWCTLLHGVHGVCASDLKYCSL